MRLFKGGNFVQDPWSSREILTLSEFTGRDQQDLPSPLGVRLDPGLAVESIADRLHGIELIAISFPKFTDGRGYSMGWLLRSRLGFKGEMRAIGDVLFDEIQFMVRCGFDAFEIVDDATLRLLEDGRRAKPFDRFYQPGLEVEVPVGTRPWARRATGRPGTLAEAAC